MSRYVFGRGEEPHRLDNGKPSEEPRRLDIHMDSEPAPDPWRMESPDPYDRNIYDPHYFAGNDR